jgi:hypothetical protein
MYDNRINIDYENEIVEKEMHKVRIEALRKVSSVFAHQEYVEEFALSLAYSWFDSEWYAEKIARDLDLYKEDFLAIQENFDAFKECYLKDLEYAVNFE